MILTVTPAPGLDRTYRAAQMLEGRVNRAISSEVEASGKGVNVSRALAAAGAATVAVLPLGGPEGRHLAELLTADAVPFLAVQTSIPTRTNTTLAVVGHSTTKMNAPSPGLPESVWDDVKRIVEDLLLQHPGAWVLCSGSVPAGADQLPAQLVELARRLGARSAVDSSGAALDAALAARPDLIAPNHLELAELIGVDVHTLDPDGRDSAGTSLVELASGWAQQLSARTGGAVLATLGAGGAVYADGRGCWHAVAPAIVPVNTVGAGDALLAGFLSVAGSANPGEIPAPGGALATAVAWGTAACAMQSTSGDVAGGADVTAVRITALS
ncbi:1-phosphofructokinase family hexose kinase [Nakamurella sp. PAMC28650]|uniref:1-phosphofructokinase family hexose kinase n=1 Tax=Nakamurella sp. PAMC28650 TaxID=2762325 RepID=UPI00164E249A|nr:hexose kinase [Nakamurella sp. PAMC28650]QNK81263.1 hexose kinase [Nakamurella sp. PAMC28650]